MGKVTMTLIDSRCKTDGCRARAIYDVELDGQSLGRFCTRDAHKTAADALKVEPPAAPLKAAK